MVSLRLKRNKQFHFFVSPVRREGEIASRITSINIETIELGIYPEQVFLKQARAALAERSGREIEAVLHEIAE